MVARFSYQKRTNIYYKRIKSGKPATRQCISNIYRLSDVTVSPLILLTHGNTLRIINATNHQLPGDRESLFWVNVKAIPAMEKDQKNENTLQLAIISRIKMFYRPTHLAMAPEEAPAMLRFRRSGSKLTLINPTPYFITVTNMKAGNSNLPNTMVPPKGEVSVDIPHAVTGDISFQTINDYGALTPRIKATMQ